MPNVQPMLRGKPVLVMRRGVFPNQRDIADVMSSWPNHIVRCEHMFPYRFVVTVKPR